MDSFPNAVKNEDGTLKNYLLKIGGKPFRCECRCNVFHIPDKNCPETYECNSCGANYTTESE